MGTNLVISPSLMREIEDRMHYIVTSTWARREQNMWWRRVMKTRTSTTKKEFVQWMLETAQIQEMGPDGGKQTFEDLTEIAFEIEVEKHGNALRLTDDSLRDGEALDRAGQWARQMGNAGAYWPQLQAARLLKSGKTLTCYDGGVFFRSNHPVNPHLGTGAGTFSNLHTALPFSMANLAAVYASVEAINAPDGNPRHLRPTIVMGGPDLRFAITQALGAEFVEDPQGSSGGTAQNIIKTAYGFVEPIIAPELNETGVWYVGCELVEDDELAGLIFTERDPFSLNSYSPLQEAQLGLLDVFEYQFKGRHASSYGHPFLLHRCEPT